MENWVTLKDESTGRFYYHNKTTGVTQWHPPQEVAPIPAAPAAVPRPRPAASEESSVIWYETYDHNSGRDYYYNTKTGESRWVRPTDGRIMPHPQQNRQTLNIGVSPRQPEKVPEVSVRLLPRHPVAEIVKEHTQKQLEVEPKKYVERLGPGWVEYEDPASKRKYYSNKTTGVTTWDRQQAIILEEAPIQPTLLLPRAEPTRVSSGTSSTPVAPLANRSNPLLGNRPATILANPITSALGFDSPRFVTPLSPSSPTYRPGSWSGSVGDRATIDMHNVSGSVRVGPTNGNSSPRGPRSLPLALIVDINKFQETEFVRKHFSNHKKGVFRRNVPLREFMTHRKEPLTAPLLKCSKQNERLAPKISKSLLVFSGDVKGPSMERAGLEVVNIGCTTPECRDEIFLQLCKQVTENPSVESSLRYWGLLALCLFAFPATRDLESHLQTVFDTYSTVSEESIATFAKYSRTRLGKQEKNEKRTISLDEVRLCPELPWKPNPFNCTIDELLVNDGLDPNTPSSVPKFLVKLINGIRQNNGFETEGIFRIAANTELIEESKNEIISGVFKYENMKGGKNGISTCICSNTLTHDYEKDPHVFAILLKQWLRDLIIPVVIPDMYEQCTRACRDPAKCIQLLSQLPVSHQSVMIYIVRFLQELAKYEKHTKMDTRNLALVLSPNMLRCPAVDPQEVFQKAQDELLFIKALIDNLQ